MTTHEYELKGSPSELDPIISVLIDGPQPASEIYRLSGLGGQTGRALGLAVTRGDVVKEGQAFALSRSARLALLVAQIDLN